MSSLLLALCCCLWPAVQAQTLPPVQAGESIPATQPVVRLFAGGTVHSQNPGEDARILDVIVVGDRISEIGPNLSVTNAAERVDCSGLHLIPGLIDGLANHYADHDLLYVAAGITLLRDPGNERSRILQEREPEQRARMPGPDLFIAGMVLDGAPPATNHAAILRDELSAVELLPRILEDQPNYFSVARGLPSAAWRRALQAAHAAGIELWGFLPSALQLEDAFSAGMDGLFGVDAFLFAEGKPTPAEQLQARIAQAGNQEFELTPLLRAAAITLEEWRSEPEILASLAPHYLPLWRARIEEIRAQPAAIRAQSAELYQQSKELLLDLHAAGAHLVPGSGAPHPLLAPGLGLIEELLLWQSLGLQPAEILQLATAGAAQALGVADQRGRLAPGLIADMVLLGADPRQDLGALRQAVGVVLRGRWLPRTELDQALAALRTRQEAALAALAAPLDVPRPKLPEGALVLEARYETRALGLRTSAEHLAVVKEPDGATSYATRIVTPESTAGVATEVELSQRFRERNLESFELAIRGGDRELTVKGLLIGELLQVERRVNGQFMDNQRARKKIALVDIGSALTDVLIGQHWSEGTHYALYFEGLNPVESEWRVEFADDDRRLLVATGQGPLISGLSAEGAPLFSFRRAGNAGTELVRMEVHTFGGPGLALEESRIFIHPSEPAQAEAGTNK